MCASAGLSGRNRARRLRSTARSMPTRRSTRPSCPRARPRLAQEDCRRRSIPAARRRAPAKRLPTIVPPASSPSRSSPRSARRRRPASTPFRRLPTLCARANAVAARRRRLRRRGRHAARAPITLRRLRPGRFARRQPAQVAVHAVRSERFLLPAHGRRARGVLADAGILCGRREDATVRT